MTANRSTVWAATAGCLVCHRAFDCLVALDIRLCCSLLFLAGGGGLRWWQFFGGVPCLLDPLGALVENEACFDRGSTFGDFFFWRTGHLNPKSSEYDSFLAT